MVSLGRPINGLVNYVRIEYLSYEGKENVEFNDYICWIYSQASANDPLEDGKKNL